MIMDVAAAAAGARKLAGNLTQLAGTTLAKAKQAATGTAAGPALGTPADSIYARLTADHDALRALLDDLATTTLRAAKRRLALFGRLRALLGAHQQAEEAVFYAAIKDAAPTRDHALEGHEEHHLADVLVQEMARLAPGDDRWGAKL